MKKTLSQILKVIGFLALGILLLFFAFRGIAFDELGRTLKEANFWWIGLSLFILGISFLFRARRWMLLVHALGFRPTFGHTYHALMIGYLSNFALPRMGEITRCISLGKREKIPVDSLIGTVIIERVMDMIMLLLIMLVLLLSWVEKFGSFFSDNVFNPIREHLLGLFGGMFVFWLLMIALIGGLGLLIFLFRKRLARIRLVQKIISFLKGILDGLKTVYKMERKWEFIFHSFFIWFLYILMTWVVVFALEPTSHLNFVDGIFLLVVGGLGMAAPVTAGFGAYHWITSRGLVYVYGMTLEQGGAFAILAHEPNSLFTIVLGAISYLIFMTGRKKNSSPEKTE